MYGTEFNFTNSLLHGAMQGISSMVFVGIVNVKYSIKGITFGRGSWSSISDQIYTKFRREIIKKISWKTFGKMFGLSLYESTIDIIHSSLIS